MVIGTPAKTSEALLLPGAWRCSSVLMAAFAGRRWQPVACKQHQGIGGGSPTHQGVTMGVTVNCAHDQTLAFMRSPEDYSVASASTKIPLTR